jgi:hypothetical protein
MVVMSPSSMTRDRTPVRPLDQVISMVSSDRCVATDL